MRLLLLTLIAFLQSSYVNAYYYFPVIEWNQFQLGRIASDPPSRENAISFSNLYNPILKGEISVEDITDFFTINPDKPVESLLLEVVMSRMEQYGLTINQGSIDILLLSDYQRYARCSRKKHSFSVDLNLILNDPSNLSILYEALSEPIYLGLYIDGQVGLDAEATWRPSTKVIGKCVRIDKVRVDIEADVPVEAYVDMVVYPNPYIIPPEESISGQTELVLMPRGSAQVNIEKLNNIDLDLDIDASGGIGALVGGIFGDPLGGFLAELGIAEILDSSFVVDKINGYLTDFANGHIEETYTFDLTSKLGGEHVFKLPFANDIVDQLVFDILSKEGIPTVVNNQVWDKRDVLLADMLVNSKDKRGEIYQNQINNSFGAVTNVVTSILF